MEFRERKIFNIDTPPDNGDDKDIVKEGRSLELAERINALMEKEELNESEKDELTSKIQELENLHKSKEQLDKEFQQKSVDYIERILEGSAKLTDVAESLAGIDNQDAWIIRRKLLKNSEPEIVDGIKMTSGFDIGFIALGMAGVDSDEAWQLRNEWLGYGYNMTVISSLIGLDSDRAKELRAKLLEYPIELDGYLQTKAMSLAGLDSEEAWNFRKSRLATSSGAMATSLIGLDTDKAWEIRGTLIDNPNADINSLIRSITGLDSNEAWALREKFADDKANRGRVAMSLAGLDSEKAWHMRTTMILSGVSKNDIAKGLGGLDSKKAWDYRGSFMRDPAVDKGAVARGVYGDWTMVAVRKAKANTEKAQ